MNSALAHVQIIQRWQRCEILHVQWMLSACSSFFSLLFFFSSRRQRRFTSKCYVRLLSYCSHTPTTHSCGHALLDDVYDCEAIKFNWMLSLISFIFDSINRHLRKREISPRHGKTKMLLQYVSFWILISYLCVHHVHVIRLLRVVGRSAWGAVNTMCVCATNAEVFVISVNRLHSAHTDV